jgi:uncharacterized membrane protein YphA (DoxX/SURF4 family)
MVLGPHAHLVLRLGLAIVFGWFGIDKFLHVEAWYGWIPGWLAFVPQDAFLYVLGSAEVIIALLLLGGKYVRFASIACAAFLAGVVLSFGINEVTVRDIGLIAAALALALSPQPIKFHEMHTFHKFIQQRRKR